MKLVLLLGAGLAVTAAVVVWRTQHGAEIWHTASGAPPSEGP